MKLFNLIVIGTATIVLSACSDYNKVLKSEDYDLKFKVANEYFDKGKHQQSIALYEQVYQRFPKQSQGEVAYFRLGKAYYFEKDYYMGGYFLGQFVQRFPYSTKVEEATFLSAMCSVNQSPKRTLDQTDTEVAINSLQQFVDRFPNSELVDSTNNIMDKLRFKLESKEYDAVKLYDRTLKYRAAATACDIFISKYPSSSYREEVEYLLVKNSHLLAKNSIDSKKLERTTETLERYRIFAVNFPNSKYLKNFTALPANLEKEIQELEIIEENRNKEENK